MAECRSCGKEIPEGMLYCSECEARMKADESYLDSLLSSVVTNSAEAAPERPIKKTTAEPVTSVFAVKDEPEELYSEPEMDFYDEGMQENRYDIFNDTDDSFLEDLFENVPAEDTGSKDVAVSSEDELLEDLLRSVDDAEADVFDLAEMQADAAAYDGAVQEDSVTSEKEDVFAFAMDEAMEQATEEFDSYDEALEAEAALLGAALAEEVFSAEEDTAAEVAFATEDEPIPEDFFGMLSAQEPEEMQDGEDPFAMLGFATESSEPAGSFEAGSADDIMDIWGLMNSDTTEEQGTAAFGDFPELFGEDENLMNIPEAATEEKSSDSEKTEKKKKESIFKRIFGNIREELTEEEIEERKRKALEKFEEDELKAADEVAQEKLNKEQKAKLKEEEAAQKQAEKEAIAKKKAEEKRLKAEQKKLLKDKREQAKRALLAEIEENEGKINKFGASIIVVMFAGMLCLIMLGTSYYNYRISIDKAQFDFDLQRYDEAYNDVYGLEIKEEDMELYDKIMTVQYVNVQLLSYMRYHSLDMDAEALDSLIKGLRRYEKLIQHGTELGVKEDLNYLKEQIVTQLDGVFGIDEATAYDMLALETQEAYSVQIYDIVSKKN